MRLGPLLSGAAVALHDNINEQSQRECYMLCVLYSKVSSQDNSKESV